MASLSNAIAALALFLLNGADAFWRMNCAVVQTGRIDPLVNPGAVSAHVHTIVGGSNIGVNATFDSMSGSECTSCEIEADKSGYWTPLLYYQYPNGSFIEVPHGGSVIYYLGRVATEEGGGTQASAITPYPPGFKMLTGDKGARSYDNETMTWGNATYPGRPIADRISFVCLPDGPPLPEYPYMFNTTCPNGMRAQIVFQSCWNGVDLYLADNSHVAYLSQLDSGACPPGYPYQLPTLFIETDYAVGQVPDQAPGGQFVFSQGDPTGYGFHADFINGWDIDVLQGAVADCLVPDNFGQISYCPVLYASDTNGYAVNCPQQPPEIDEQVHGLLDKLPGCITITYGPEEATDAQMVCPPSIPQPSIIRTVDSTPRPTALPTTGQQFGLANEIYLGCYNDSAGGPYRTLNSISMTNYTAMTPEFCQNWCNSQGYRLSGVEYAQECHCDNYINPTAVLSGPDFDCTWWCGGTNTVPNGTIDICGGLGYISVFNNTNPNFDAFGSNANTAGNAQPYQPAAGFGANYLGCYSDNSGGGRTLTGTTVSQDNMTLAICAAYCGSGLGYQYYGLEFSTQCWCGNIIANGGSLLTPTTTPSNDTCQQRCGGAGAEICGGPNALSLYNNTAFIPPAHKPAIGKYHLQGCLSDPNTQGRSLQGASEINANMTEDMCVKFCLGHEYHYSGIEYGTQCFCGNSILTQIGAQLISCPNSTIMRCPGDEFEYCGGPGFMSLYYSTTL